MINRMRMQWNSGKKIVCICFVREMLTMGEGRDICPWSSFRWANAHKLKKKTHIQSEMCAYVNTQLKARDFHKSHAFFFVDYDFTLLLHLLFHFFRFSFGLLDAQHTQMKCKLVWLWVLIEFINNCGQSSTDLRGMKKKVFNVLYSHFSWTVNSLGNCASCSALFRSSQFVFFLLSIIFASIPIRNVLHLFAYCTVQ